MASNPLDVHRGLSLPVLGQEALALQRAFAAHDLDNPNDPRHQRALLIRLAVTLYGMKHKGGRPPKWAAAAVRRQFADDYDDAVKAVRKRGERTTREHIAEQMQLTRPDKYPQSIDRLVKLISKQGQKPKG